VHARTASLVLSGRAVNEPATRTRRGRLWLEVGPALGCWRRVGNVAARLAGTAARRKEVKEAFNGLHKRRDEGPGTRWSTERRGREQGEVEEVEVGQDGKRPDGRVRLREAEVAHSAWSALPAYLSSPPYS